ncbi:Uncharacterized protein FWK35_00014364, partial [Aphis craccivora]
MLYLLLLLISLYGYSLRFLSIVTMAEIKYKFEAVMIVSGAFMLLTVYDLPVASYFKVFPTNCHSTVVAFGLPNMLHVWPAGSHS